jgi:hypothetical protein
MKTGFSLILIGLFALSCRNDRSAADYEALPELPDEILSQLDTARMATATTNVFVEPVRDTMPGVLLAPCCGIRIERSLQVTMPYTKCGPLLDFIVADFDNMVASRSNFRAGPSDTTAGNVKMYKLANERFSRGRLGQWVCITSQGPWNAVLTETRSCNGYSPVYSLVIMPYGDVVVKQWTGGIGNHPAAIGLVSCRTLATTETPCGGLSNCECRSTQCKAPDPCNCGIDDEW